MNVAFLPVSSPFGTPFPYVKVLPTRAIWSIHSFSTEGTPKLCRGTPKTYSSACWISVSSLSDSASNSFCCGERASSGVYAAPTHSALTGGIGVAVRSRSITVAPGGEDFHWLTKAPVSWRETDRPYSGLESTCRSVDISKYLQCDK